MPIRPVLTGFAGQKAICDTETYPNYILIKFENVDTGEVTRFVVDETHNESKAAFAYFQSLSVVVGYNSHGFDDFILDLAFKGVDSQTIYELADLLINGIRGAAVCRSWIGKATRSTAIRCRSTSRKSCGARSARRLASRYLHSLGCVDGFNQH
jgi:hypothetical protein